MRLGAHVSSLDPLGQLDLLRCRQQRVAAGLAQEELQRVGRRLVRGLERGRSGLLLFLRLLDDDVDPPPLELVEERLGLERVELMSLDQLSKLRLLDRARAFSVLQQSLDVLVLEDRLDLDGHLPNVLMPLGRRSQTRGFQVAATPVNPLPSIPDRMHGNLRYVKSEWNWPAAGPALASPAQASPEAAPGDLVVLLNSSSDTQETFELTHGIFVVDRPGREHARGSRV